MGCQKKFGHVQDSVESFKFIRFLQFVSNLISRQKFLIRDIILSRILALRQYLIIFVAKGIQSHEHTGRA